MKPFVFITVLFVLAASFAHADSGGVIGDINMDDKIDLREAIYALRVVAGAKTDERTIEPFDVYRADVIRELKRFGERQEYWKSLFNFYINDINMLKSSLTYPSSQIEAEVLSANADQFNIQASHKEIPNYSWTMDRNLNFEENGAPFKPETEVFEICRENVIRKLRTVNNIEQTYKAEYNTFTDDIASQFSSGEPFPEVTVEIIEASSNNYVAQATHPKIKGYAWQMNQDTEIQTILVASAGQIDLDNVIGDINSDNRIDLQEAIYAMRVAAGIKSDLRKLEPFEVYRADVIQELRLWGQKQECFMAINNYYESNMKVLKWMDQETCRSTSNSQNTWPHVQLEITEATDHDFTIRGSHDKIADQFWTVKTGLIFEENGASFKPEMEIFELYRYDVVEKLKFILNIQRMHYMTYELYVNDIGSYIESWEPHPEVEFKMLEATADDFIAEAAHPRIKGYAWQIDSHGNIRTIEKPE